MRIAKLLGAAALIPMTIWALESSTPPSIDQVQPFLVAGYLVRTNNAIEATTGSRIGPLWQRFLQENLAAQIPDRIDSAVTVVYSNYASDQRGDYDYLLGARVRSIDRLPAGIVSRRVEAGNYAVFLTERGAMPGVLQAEWKKIWKMSAAETGGRRRFVTDYETYDQRSADPAHAQVEIHLGIERAK